MQPTSEWLAQVPARYRKRAVHYTNLGEARKIHAPVFLKPAEHKLFAAQVYSSGHILPHGSELPDDLPVLISEPVTWRVEYRCFVLDRRVEALSPYWRSGRSPQRCGRGPADPDERRAALAFARTMLADPEVLFPPAGVLDVGEIEGGGWAVVEANPAWASGLYDCKPARILHVLRRACIPLAAVSATDDRWILPGPPERS